MKSNIMFILTAISIVIVGMVNLVYQIYKMVVIDAKSRGLKHSGFCGLFSIGGQNGSGLILYLIGRKKYPIKSISPQENLEIQNRKKKAGISIIFLAIGAISFVMLTLL